MFTRLIILALVVLEVLAQSDNASGNEEQTNIQNQASGQEQQQQQQQQYETSSQQGYTTSPLDPSASPSPTEYTSPSSNHEEDQTSIQGEVTSWISSYTPTTTSTETTTTTTTSIITEPSQSTLYWVHIHPQDHMDLCLAVFDTSGTPYTKVALKSCEYSGKEAQWVFYTEDTTRVYSRAFEDVESVEDKDKEWCLDGGASNREVQPVTINRLRGHPSLAIYERLPPPRIWVNQKYGLGIKVGHIEGGGFIQTWSYVHGNTNQAWLTEDVEVAVQAGSDQV